jgi:microcystin-dependent protein
MDPYIGEIRMFAGNFAPQGWFFCDGSMLSINQYQAFFSLIGTTYGGDGMSTFQIPDLRGRAPIHSGNGQGRGVSRYELGQLGGTENVTLSVQQMPAHGHQVLVIASAADQSTPENNFLSIGVDGSTGNAATSYQDFVDTTLPQTYLNQKTVVPSGGNQPVNVVTPYLGINFIIAWQGIWPSRP